MNGNSRLACDNIRYPSSTRLLRINCPRHAQGPSYRSHWEPENNADQSVEQADWRAKKLARVTSFLEEAFWNIDELQTIKYLRAERQGRQVHHRPPGGERRRARGKKEAITNGRLNSQKDLKYRRAWDTTCGHKAKDTAPSTAWRRKTENGSQQRKGQDRVTEIWEIYRTQAAHNASKMFFLFFLFV